MSPRSPFVQLSSNRRRALRQRARMLRRKGYRHIAGVDEAGAGPLAGPLVAAAVILPPRARLPGADDSKTLSARARAYWAQRIKGRAVASAIAIVSVAELDEIGPYQAAIQAMERAVMKLTPQADYLLIDARHLPRLHQPQEAIVGGDGKHLAIAAASILAKVCRDAIMRRLDEDYPGYGFARHKGYGTPAHLEALERLGPCPAHRCRYAPVRRLLEGQARLF